MKKFLIELHQQLEHLEMFMELQANQKSGTVGGDDLRLQAKMYF